MNQAESIHGDMEKLQQNQTASSPPPVTPRALICSLTCLNNLSGKGGAHRYPGAGVKVDSLPPRLSCRCHHLCLPLLVYISLSCNPPPPPVLCD
jgi:hypothetical protein